MKRGIKKLIATSLVLCSLGTSAFANQVSNNEVHKEPSIGLMSTSDPGEGGGTTGCVHNMEIGGSTTCHKHQNCTIIYWTCEFCGLFTSIHTED